MFAKFYSSTNRKRKREGGGVRIPQPPSLLVDIVVELKTYANKLANSTDKGSEKKPLVR